VLQSGSGSIPDTVITQEWHPMAWWSVAVVSSALKVLINYQLG